MTSIHLLILMSLTVYWGWQFTKALTKDQPWIEPFTKFVLCAALINALVTLSKLNP